MATAVAKLHLAQEPPGVVATGRAAWRRFREAQDVGLDQLMDVARALMEGRRHALREAETNKPIGLRYSRAFQAWCAAHGLDDVPKNWRGCLLWCLENEAEVRAMWADHEAIKKTPPSLDPRNMANMTRARRKNGPPRKRRAPTIAALPINTLCAGLGNRLAELDPTTALGEIARLAAALEAAAVIAQARKAGEAAQSRNRR